MNFYKNYFKTKLTIIFVFLFIQFSYSQISASKDNTLYQDLNGNLSNGSGSYFFVGVNNNGGIYRGLVAFDISSTIPSNATISSVTLTLNMSRTSSGSQSLAIHKVDNDWGEGSSNAGGEEGMGAASTTDDATWIHTFYNTDTWTSAGGDYNAGASASLSVAGTGQYTWGSNASMVADVQSWIDTPSENYGWIIIGNEGALQTSKRFDTKENSNASNRPVINVTYTTPNNPPEANNDNAVSNEDNSVNIDVLFNDEDDVSLDASSVAVTNNPTNGSISNINTTSGVVTYIPNDNYNGLDSFRYTVDDNEGATSNEATVNITVNSINDAPTAATDNSVINEDNSAVVDVLNNDDDIDGILLANTVAIANAPQNGSVTNINSSTGAITYTPNDNYNGSDSFTYTVEDDSGDVSNSATVSIIINSLNDAPIATNDTSATNEDNSVIVSVLTNDNDIDGSLIASTWSEFFGGAIDEVRYWNIARDSLQINVTMFNTLGSEYTSTTDSGLVAYYKFDELEDLGIDLDGVDDVRDYSLSENHGDTKGEIFLTSSGAFTITGLKQTNKKIPSRYILKQNYPNPFNPSTMISYQLAKNSKVLLKIYDASGREIKTLLNKQQPAGEHTITFNARDLSSGIYFYRLITDKGFVQTRKLIFLK